jgi:voltage-gated potassium channel
VYERFEQRAVKRLSTLRLRSAVGLIVGSATTLAVTAAIVVHVIDPGIGTWGDAFWWAVTTVTTVGYGDVVPESAGGRLVGAALMLTGIGLIPIITSVVVSILVSQGSREARQADERNVKLVIERLEAIERRLETLEPR